MYITTEDDEYLEIQEDDDPYVKPSSETSEWELLVDIEDEAGEETIIIATFETVEEANDALNSLREAIDEDEGWDVRKFQTESGVEDQNEKRIPIQKEAFEMEFEPMESIVIKTAVEIAKWIRDEYRESRQSQETQDDERKEECVLKTLYILRQESESKKLDYIRIFAESTILSKSEEIHTDTILSFLKDIEQMTWRQLCLLEGFNRKQGNRIKVNGYDDEGIDGMSRETEIKELIALNYLRRSSNQLYSLTSTHFEHISISSLGHELSRLMGLQSIDISEIGKAFGTGRIEETIRH